MKYGYIIDPDNNEIIDEVLVSFFANQKVILWKICVKLILMEE